jgi:hypothetical protein
MPLMYSTLTGIRSRSSIKANEACDQRCARRPDGEGKRLPDRKRQSLALGVV